MNYSLNEMSDEEIRGQFALPEDIAYFNCAYLSPMLKSAIEAGDVSGNVRARPWRITEENFYAEIELTRRLFAQLIHTSEDNIALIPAASYGLAIACRNTRLTPQRCRIVLVENEHPSNYLQWREKARSEGGELTVVPLSALRDSSEALCDAIDDRTAVVSLSPCHWIDGTLIDLKAVAGAARAAGAGLVVDGTQSIGVLPFDFDDIRPDYLIVAGYKWLLGPYSVGFLAAPPERHHGTPLEFSKYNCGAEPAPYRWSSGRLAYPEGGRRGARRYDVGENANFCLMPMVNCGLAWVNATKSGLSERLGGITDTLVDILAEHNILPLAAGNHAPHLLGFQADGRRQRLIDAFRNHKICISVYGDIVRFSPHVYNTKSDLDALAAAVHGALGATGES